MLYFTSYYRYVLEPDLTFRPDGSLTSGPVARFTDLPQKSILTMGVNPPESWLVESVKAPHDLDNLLLEEVGRMKETSHLSEDFCLSMCVGGPIQYKNIFNLLSQKKQETHSFFDILFVTVIGESLLQ